MFAVTFTMAVPFTLGTVLFLVPILWGLQNPRMIGSHSLAWSKALLVLLVLSYAALIWISFFGGYKVL